MFSPDKAFSGFAVDDVPAAPRPVADSIGEERHVGRQHAMDPCRGLTTGKSAAGRRPQHDQFYQRRPPRQLQAPVRWPVA